MWPSRNLCCKSNHYHLFLINGISYSNLSIFGFTICLVNRPGLITRQPSTRVLPSDCPARFGWTSRQQALSGKSATRFVTKLVMKLFWRLVRIPAVGQLHTITMQMSSVLLPFSTTCWRTHDLTAGISTGSASIILEQLNIFKFDSMNSPTLLQARSWHSWWDAMSIITHLISWSWS